MKNEKSKRMMKEFIIFVLLVGFAVLLGCSAANEWALKKVSDRVKTETILIDKVALVDLPKEIALVEVSRAPNADPALSDEILKKMEVDIIEEFAKFVEAGWSINQGSPLKLYVTLSIYKRSHIKGIATFKIEEEGKEDRVVAIFALDFLKDKRILDTGMNTTYMTNYWLRRLFAHGIIEAIEGHTK